MSFSRKLLSLMATVLLLLGYATGSDNSKSTQLFVTIVPEVFLQQESQVSILVKIRLSPNENAKIWIGTCAEIPTQFYQVSQSGIYHVLLSDIGNGKNGDKVCLVSSDQVLFTSIPLN